MQQVALCNRAAATPSRREGNLQVERCQLDVHDPVGVVELQTLAAVHVEARRRLKARCQRRKLVLLRETRGDGQAKQKPAQPLAHRVTNLNSSHFDTRRLISACSVASVVQAGYRGIAR